MSDNRQSTTEPTPTGITAELEQIRDELVRSNGKLELRKEVNVRQCELIGTKELLCSEQYKGEIERREEKIRIESEKRQQEQMQYRKMELELDTKVRLLQDQLYQSKLDHEELKLELGKLQKKLEQVVCDQSDNLTVVQPCNDSTMLQNELNQDNPQLQQQITNE
jgi:hypothetical protein